jgi:hypothetical protein
MGLIKQLYGDHNKEELIRTVDSALSVLLQLIAIGIQGLWSLVHHASPTLKEKPWDNLFFMQKVNTILN